MPVEGGREALLVILGKILPAGILCFIRGVDSADIELARRIGERIPEGRWLRVYDACLDAIERVEGRGSPGGRA